jgi:hypothetical protein
VVTGGHGEGGLPSFEELTGTGPAGDQQATVDEVKRSLGIGVPRRRYDGPDLRGDLLDDDEELGPWRD